MKRFLIYFTCLSLVVCLCFGITVSAEESENDNIVNLSDYIYSYLFNDDGTGFVSVSFPDEFYRIQTVDMNGTKYLPEGTKHGRIYSNKGDGSVISLGMYVPGSYINDTFFNISALHTGAIVSCEYEEFELISSPQDYLIVKPAFRIAYFDKDFVEIGYQREYGNDIIVDASGYSGGFKKDISVVVPENSQYFILYLTLEVTVDRSYSGTSYLSYTLDFPEFEIQTNYYNTIINGMIKPKPPESSGTINDAQDIEDVLHGSTSDGRNDASNTIENSFDIIGEFIGGFACMLNVFNMMTASAWIDGALTVSLGLGIFSYVCNVSNTVGRSLEHAKSKGGGK